MKGQEVARANLRRRDLVNNTNTTQSLGAISGGRTMSEFHATLYEARAEGVAALKKNGFDALYVRRRACCRKGARVRAASARSVSVARYRKVHEHSRAGSLKRSGISITTSPAQPKKKWKSCAPAHCDVFISSSNAVRMEGYSSSRRQRQPRRGATFGPKRSGGRGHQQGRTTRRSYERMKAYAAPSKIYGLPGPTLV